MIKSICGWFICLSRSGLEKDSSKQGWRKTISFLKTQFFTQITYSSLTFFRMSITKIPSNLMINYQLIEMQKTSSHLPSDPTVAWCKLQQQQRTTQHFLTSPQTSFSRFLWAAFSLFPTSFSICSCLDSTEQDDL